MFWERGLWLLPHHWPCTSYILLEIILGLWEFGDLGHELHYGGISLEGNSKLVFVTIFNILDLEVKGEEVKPPKALTIVK